MKSRNLTIKELSIAVDVPTSSIFSWLNGTTPQNFQAVKRIADFFNCSSIEDLLMGESAKPKKVANIQDLFDVSDLPEMEGLFLLQARRLTPKK